jgi:nucleotide-binding universal stress UspA family protein
MFSKIVVPLDGSKVAETALPYARMLAEKLGVMVELLTVIDPAEIELYVADPDALTEVVCYHKARFEQYLSKVAKSFSGSRTECRVERGRAAERIIDAAAESGETLIVMASHGLSGLQRWLLGSVAEKVLRGTSSPLFLVRAGADGAANGLAAPGPVIIPLDGSELSERALAPGLELARRLNVEAVLARSFEFPTTAYYRADDYPPSADKFIPSYRKLVEAMGREAREYLDAKVKEISASIPVQIRAEVIEGSAAERIIDLGRSTKSGLIVICTHGRSGFKRWVLGSVAEKVARHADNPVLIIRAS